MRALTVLHNEHFLLAHVLHVDGAVNDEIWSGAVVLPLVLTLITLDLQRHAQAWGGGDIIINISDIINTIIISSRPAALVLTLITISTTT